MNDPTPVTVVIPCFNDGPFLKHCLQSVLAQNLNSAEVLIINDGSTDRKTLKYLENIDLRGVRVVHQENKGLAGARNSGIRAAKGKYVYFLDADNILLPQCLSELVSLLDGKDDALAAYSKMRFVGGPMNGSEWGESYNPYLLLVNNLWDAGILLRREAVERHNLFYDEGMRHGYEDWDFNIRLIATGKPILFCPRALYKYRVRKNSLLKISHSLHKEIVSYIFNKHKLAYSANNLVALKRSFAPALIVDCKANDEGELKKWLGDQTFRDWGLNTNLLARPTKNSRYYFSYSELAALQKLPPEALECAVMLLESNPSLPHCVLATRSDSLPIFAAASANAQLTRVEFPKPVAFIVRSHLPTGQSTAMDVLQTCKGLIDFPDQKRDLQAGWDSDLLRFAQIDRNAWKDITTVRKRVSSASKELLGSTLHGRSLQIYDMIYYNMLLSDSSFALREKIRASLGERTERWLSGGFYGLFLAKPPTETRTHITDLTKSSANNAFPLFVTSSHDKRVNVLIATSWLNEGGVEQHIFDLCRLLNRSPFRIIIATTRASSHPWDRFARELGVSVYHLGDFLRAGSMPYALAHLILNHEIDCLHIVQSKETYMALKTLHRLTPWLSISDRIELLEPGGGYPKLSARLSKGLIHARTVSHRRLAEQMSESHKLPLESVRTIYAGTDLRRIEAVLGRRSSVLHNLCGLKPETPIVAFVGRLTSQKRPEIFLQSVARLLQINPDCPAHFAMVGDGEMRKQVEALRAGYNLQKRVHLLGAHSNAKELMADSTVLLMPSAYEGLALVSYEAMALGVPQIFANVNGQSELITPETGILIDNGPGEETRYAKACLELISDPNRRARMAAAGRVRIKSHFTAENAVKQYAQIFEEMAELGRKRASEIPHLRPPHINPLQDIV